MTVTTFTVAVHDSGQAAHLAQRFVVAALEAGHRIEQVFFYHGAVYEGDAQRQPAQDDPQLLADWAELAARGEFPLNVCIAAALRRGVLNSEEATRYDKAAGNLADGFDLVGLGVYIDGLLNADRVVTFAN